MNGPALIAILVSAGVCFFLGLGAGRSTVSRDAADVPVSALLEEAVRDGGLLRERYSRILKAVERCALAEFPETYRFLAVEPGCEMLAQWIWSRWLDEDPVGALGATLDGSLGKDLRTFAMDHCVEHCPSEAWQRITGDGVALGWGLKWEFLAMEASHGSSLWIDRVESAPELLRHRERLNDVLISIPRDGAAVLIAAMARLPGTVFDDGVVGVLTEGFARESPEEALKVLASVQDSGLRAELRNRVAEGWGRSDPAGAKKWVESVAPRGDTRDQLVRSLIEGAIWSDPSWAAKAAFEIKSSALREQALARAVWFWRKTDEDAAKDWAGESLSGPDLDAALSDGSDLFDMFEEPLPMPN